MDGMMVTAFRFLSIFAEGANGEGDRREAMVEGYPPRAITPPSALRAATSPFVLRKNGEEPSNA